MNQRTFSYLRLRLLLLSIFILGAQTGFAQNIPVTGKVTDAGGLPLIGVNILVKGTTTGTTTGMDGTYKISVPDRNSVLVFRYIGYTEFETAVNDRSEINVVLQESTDYIDEVVVTALGIKAERKALGYATGEVTGDALLTAKTSNFANSLAGKVAGVQVTQSSGQHGGGTRMIIRGGSSITGNNQPLVIVDGVQYNTSNYLQSTGFSDIDPAAIESVSILKGAAASALYGSNAANGVILITTKAGALNSPLKVNVRHSSSFENVIEVPLQKTWAQGIAVDGVYTYNETVRYSWGPRISDLPGVEYFDRWEIFKTGYTSETSVDLSGGNERAGYFMSYSNYDNNGVLDPQSFQRNIITGNAKYKFSERLTMSTMFSYTRSEQNRIREGYRSMFDYFLNMPNSWNPYPVYDEDGKLRAFRGGRDPYLWTLENELRIINRDRFFSNISIDYQILPSLTFRSVSGINTLNFAWEDQKNRDGIRNPAGWYNSIQRFSRDMESTNMLTYENRFGDFSVTALFGHNIQSQSWSQSDFKGSGLAVPGVYNKANVSSYTADYSTWDYRIWSLFGEARIGYKSMIYYSLSGRNDWTSTLADDYFYPSHNVSFVFSELLGNKAVLSFGKLRASYAKVGAPATPYITNTVMKLPGAEGVSWPFQGQTSYVSSNNYPNPNLVNELKTELEVGTELRFFQNRLGVDLSLYKMWSNNQILWQSLLNSSGYTGGYINIGEIEHKGIELMLQGKPVQTSNFVWDLAVNWSLDRSMVIKLGYDDRPISVGSGYWEGARAVVGYPYPIQWGRGYLTDDQGRMVLDDREPGTAGYGRPIREPNRRNLGLVEPDWIASVMNRLQYKGLSLFAQLDIKKGGYLFNEDTDYHQFGMGPLQEDRPENDMTTFDGVMGHLDSDGNIVISSETPVPTSYSGFFALWYDTEIDNIQPAGYVKLREVTLQFELPAAWYSRTFIKGMAVSVSGRNLWRKFGEGYTGSDPENVATDADEWYHVDNNSAKQSFIFPGTKQYTFGINVTF